MENDKFIITEEIIANATTYVPLAEKAAFAKTVAARCVYAVELTQTKIESNATFSMPQLYAENYSMKQIWLMQYFLERYLHIEVPDEFGYVDYDDYASSHPMNQLERFKGKAEIKDKVFDILADFKEVKKMLDVEIYNFKLSQNDGMERFFAGMTLLTTPENVAELQKELDTEIKKVDALNKQKQQTEKLRELIKNLPPDVVKRALESSKEEKAKTVEEKKKEEAVS